MFKNKKYLILVFICLFFAYCNQKDKEENDTDTFLKGSASIYVDETVSPIVEDQVMIFESKYEANFAVIPKSESEVLNSLFDKKATIAVLSRNLSKKELKIFEQRKIVPRITKFATDAIAFVSNKNEWWFSQRVDPVEEACDFWRAYHMFATDILRRDYFKANAAKKQT